MLLQLLNSLHNHQDEQDDYDVMMMMMAMVFSFNFIVQSSLSKSCILKRTSICIVNVQSIVYCTPQPTISIHHSQILMAVYNCTTLRLCTFASNPIQTTASQTYYIYVCILIHIVRSHFNFSTKKMKYKINNLNYYTKLYTICIPFLIQYPFCIK